MARHFSLSQITLQILLKHYYVNVRSESVLPLLEQMAGNQRLMLCRQIDQRSRSQSPRR